MYFSIDPHRLFKAYLQELEIVNKGVTLNPTIDVSSGSNTAWVKQYSLRHVRLLLDYNKNKQLSLALSKPTLLLYYI